MNTPPNNTPTRSVIAHLRSMLPTRPLQVWEARRVAETQASRLRMLLGDPTPHFDTNQLGDLPRIAVTYDDQLRASGSSHWRNGAWHIEINPGEALVRQRFTLAHELKHVIDAPLVGRSYSEIAARIDGDQQIEAISDCFAACLLMPKRWVKRLWGEGINDLTALADTFDVSTAAMKRRIEDLGLVDWPQRHRHRAHPGVGPRTFYRPPPRRHVLQETT
jgi:predicted transcriptional regulator